MVQWDSFSDQPYRISDKTFKRRERLRQWPELLKVALTALVFFPLGRLGMYFPRRERFPEGGRFFGMSVNLDKEPETSPMLIEELGVTHLLMRIPLWDMENLERYAVFAEQFGSDKEWVIVLMQDRALLGRDEQLRRRVEAVFRRCAFAKTFQFGIAINRYKWGYMTPGEYLRQYRVVWELKENQFPHYRLLGPSVIDYEYHITVRALFNGFKLRFDALSALLYVDRRGAPENRQAGLNLVGKLRFLGTLGRLSFKVREKRIWVTETNWPIKETAPYTPTSEKECVDEHLHAAYMVRYYLLALAEGEVEAVFWHQLVAPGFGLLDSREGLRKRPAFFAFVTMHRLLKAAVFQELRQEGAIYTALFTEGSRELRVLWCNGTTAAVPDGADRLIGMTGESVPVSQVAEAPIYWIKER